MDSIAFRLYLLLLWVTSAKTVLRKGNNYHSHFRRCFLVIICALGGSITEFTHSPSQLGELVILIPCMTGAQQFSDYNLSQHPLFHTAGLLWLKSRSTVVLVPLQTDEPKPSLVDRLVP